MADTIQCSNCGKQYPASPKFHGKRVRCKECGHTFLVSAPSANLEPVATAAHTIQCPGCKKQYPANPGLLGKKVQCKRCGQTFSVPAPKAEPYVPMATLIEPEPVPVALAVSLEDLARPSAAAGSNDSPPADGRGSLLPSLSAGIPLAKRPVPRPERFRDVRKKSVKSWFAFLNRYSLATATLVWAVSVGILLWCQGSLFFIGCIVMALGIVIALSGFRPEAHHVRSARASANNEHSLLGKLGEIIGTVAFIGVIIAKVLSRYSGHNDERLKELVKPFLGRYGGVALVVLFLLVGITLFFRATQRFGFFRSAACLFMCCSLAFSLNPTWFLGIMHLPLPEPAQVATKSVKPISPCDFPDHGPPQTLERGVGFCEVDLGVPHGQPGFMDKLYIYLPDGNHAPHSLPCVMIAPAGTMLITGMELGSGDQTEHLPYVRAGFAVVAYELDGRLGDPAQASVFQVQRAVNEFLAAQSGLVNARNALDYITNKLPEIDPNRIYTVGHSSAATVALLVAEHEPRIHGCVAYAPVANLSNRFQDGLDELRDQVPQIQQVIDNWSPHRFASRMNCPVLLFHARDDSNVPFSGSENFAKLLKDCGKQVDLTLVPSGDHYDSMIRQGIPKGIQWLKQIDRR